MLKFFRTIRRGLLAENRTTKYLLYAVGEIVLVVIGILIALQINNWNEDRKLRSQEHLILADLKSDLIESKEELEKMIVYNDSTVYFYNYILEQMETDNPPDAVFERGLSFFTAWDSPYLTYTAYETLKNKGLDLIQNRDLKKQIVALYETTFAGLVNDYDRAEWVLAQAVTMPLANKVIRRVTGEVRRAVPMDYETLRHNDEFINALHQLIVIRKQGIRSCERVVSAIDHLIMAIDNKLGGNPK